MPTQIIFTVLLEINNSFILIFASFVMAVLKPPHNPLSDVIKTIKWVLLFSFPLIISGAFSIYFILEVILSIIFCILFVYGLEDSASVLAFFNLAPATNFMAEVIFFVDWTLLILSLKSFKLAII